MMPKMVLHVCLCAALLAACGGGSSSTRGAEAIPAGPAQGAAARAALGAAQRMTAPTCSGAGTPSFLGYAGNVAAANYSGVVSGTGNEVCDEESGVVSGSNNFISSGSDAAYASFIGSGQSNQISGVGSQNTFIGAGSFNTVSSQYALSFIGSGSQNTITGQSASAFIGAGQQNTVTTASHAFLGAGVQNGISAQYGVIAGGLGNTVSQANGAIVGGTSNSVTQTNGFVGGGRNNTASGLSAVVAGGVLNVASGGNATVPGGHANFAGGLMSFAAGFNSRAAHDGTFVWSDFASGAAQLQTAAPNQFLARASGGFTFWTNPSDTVGATLAAGSGAWASASDRAMKTAVVNVDDAAVLDKVAALPITEWSYVSERGVRHVGPMAQDFYAAFRVGADDRHITSIDEDGVALAAIKALHTENAALRVRLAEVSASQAAMQRRLEALSATVEALRARR